MDISCHTGSSRPAVVLWPSGTEVSFARLDSEANRLARFLLDAGLRPGDTLAVHDLGADGRLITTATHVFRLPT